MAEESLAEKLAYWRAKGCAPGQLKPGRSKVTIVQSDYTGERVGTQTEHWDGRVDARAEKVAVTANPNLKLKESTDGPVRQGRYP